MTVEQSSSSNNGGLEMERSSMRRVVEGENQNASHLPPTAKIQSRGVQTTLLCRDMDDWDGVGST